MKVNFDLVDLQLLVHIAEERSLTGGAEKSNLSLPAASMRIKLFEQAVGEKLLFRARHGATLTPTGETVLRHARIVLQQLQGLRGELHEHVEGFKGHIRMIANATSINASLPLVLRKYLSQHPHVDVDLRERLSDEGARAVADGSADLAIVAEHTRTDGLQLLPYRRERLVLATASDHPLAGRRAISFEETLDFDYVGLYEGSAIYQFLKQRAQALNRQLNIRIQVASFDAISRMIEANVGIGVLPISAARRYAKVSDLRVIPLIDAWSIRQSWICVRRVDTLPLFAQRLVEMLSTSESVEGIDGGDVKA